MLQQLRLLLQSSGVMDVDMLDAPMKRARGIGERGVRSPRLELS
jgi:hypothetical protein